MHVIIPHFNCIKTVLITPFTVPSAARDLTITRVFDDGVELNWIPPREPNGDIRHYIIKYTTQDGTQQEFNTTSNINYYNLTGLERGRTDLQQHHSGSCQLSWGWGRKYVHIELLT